MNLKLKKVDAAIIIILIIIAGIVLFQSGLIKPEEPFDGPPEIRFIYDEENEIIRVTYISKKVSWDKYEIIGDCDTSNLTEYVLEGDEITDCKGLISIKYKRTGVEVFSHTFISEENLPYSIILSNERTVSPEDEGPHFNKKIIGSEFFREWWYYTAVFSPDSDLPGWTISVSFNHMARSDLFLLKPDILAVTLQSPDGKNKYGGIIEEERYLGILREPILQASGSNNGFKVSFNKDSFVTGKAPNWHVHIEGKIDKDHDIKMDLQFFASSSPLWIHSNRAIDKSKGSIASYVFLGCSVTGTINIDTSTKEVTGIGHHEHTWASGIVSGGIIKGWDWCHITMENGWNVYYSNYYFTSQIKSTKNYKNNPYGLVLITTDRGKTITRLLDVKVDITQSDKILLLLNIPSEMGIQVQPGISQILLNEYGLNMDMNIHIDNAISKTWKRLAHVGMKIGTCSVDGMVSWSDNDGSHEVEIDGIGTIWHMRH